MLNKIFVLILSFSQILAECPSMDQVPVMYNSDTFLCGVSFSGEGREYPIDGCNKCRPDDDENGHRMKHGYNSDAGDGRFFPMGSVIIRPGCKLYGYTVRSKEVHVRFLQKKKCRRLFSYSKLSCRFQFLPSFELRCHCLSTGLHCSAEKWKYKFLMKMNNLTFFFAFM